jgi:hypothetical protein
VAVVTDSPDRARTYAGIDRVIQAVPASGGTRYFEDYQSTVTWHNAGRVDAYALSPWERTLVLDADYVVASTDLKTLFNCNTDFMCHKTAVNLAGSHPLTGLNVFGRYNIPMSWATVMRFNRGHVAELIFDTMQMIRDNWTHYRNVYGIADATYRNDYALTIAQLIVNGQVLAWPSIPWSLTTVTPDAQLTQLADDHYRVDYKTVSGQSKWITLTQDFHAMGKRYLGDIVASAC